MITLTLTIVGCLAAFVAGWHAAGLRRRSVVVRITPLTGPNPLYDLSALHHMARVEAEAARIDAEWAALNKETDR